MKTFRDYIAETEVWIESPVAGDDFAIELAPDCLYETYVLETVEDGIIVEADDQALALLQEHGALLETIRTYGAVGNSGTGQTYNEQEKVNEGAMKELMHQDAERMELTDFVAKYGDQDWVQEFWHNIRDDVSGPEQTDRAHWDFGRMLELAGCKTMDEDQSASVLAAKEVNNDITDPMPGVTEADDEDMDEAKYQGREVPLGKPMKGDVKKSKVYVRGPKGNVVKVNFGDKTMRIKKSNPKRRKSFRARHNCANPGPRHKARYWSCRAW